MAYVAWGPPPDAPDDGWRIGGHEVRAVIESLIANIWHKVYGITLSTSFKVITYAQAMARVSYPTFPPSLSPINHPQYGSDKPDTRFSIEVPHTLSLFTLALNALKDRKYHPPSSQP